jgi:hypothetical protein
MTWVGMWNVWVEQVGNQREEATWKIRFIDRRMILTWVIQKWIGGPGVD